ncbi:MAG: FAD-binding oxidoreductase [Flavobacteriales bacterium]|nr:FAD-binding oxidoreductase [Flavobacteriales bacterium]
MTRPKSRILIVGQGIGGTSLAWTCIQKGIEFKIIDDGYKSSSSLAAAGLFNPLILKRRKLTWRADEFISRLEGFYSAVEGLLGVEVFHKSGIYRRIASIEELNDWQGLQSTPEYKKYLGKIHPSDPSGGIDAPFGYQEVKEAGYVNVDTYLRRSREYFLRHGYLLDGLYDMKSQKKEEYIEFNKSILATGFRTLKSKDYFEGLPYTPAKGHTIEIKCESLKLDKLINGPCFIIPLGEDRYRLGSTYSWSKFNNEIEEKEVNKLRIAFESMCSFSYSIEQEWAGVRPATKDRRPFVGRSKIALDTYIFNGLGSRAIMSTPTLANQLIDHITQGNPLWPDIQVERFLG